MTSLLTTLQKPVLPTGPLDARIAIVGEAPGADEVSQGAPFVGLSGKELTRMLAEAGIERSECFITNACKYRPPGNDISEFLTKQGPTPELAAGIAELQRELDTVRPNIIIALGNTPLWALTGHKGITKWRGSVLEYTTLGGHKCKLLPTYHPAAILRQWEWRAIAVMDLRRAAREAATPTLTYPQYRFTIRPSFAATQRVLAALQREVTLRPYRLAVDIETRGGHIACIGIAWSPLDAICIPFMCVEDESGYWSAEEELALVRALRDLLTHPNAQVVGQNFIYDAQFFWKHYHWLPHVTDDTMVAQHVLFAGMPKGLDFLASMYCTFYQYWKDEGKEWDAATPEDQLWAYNCKDAVNTYEILSAQLQALASYGLTAPYAERMQYWWAVFAMTVRGTLIDQSARTALRAELFESNVQLDAWLTKIVGRPLNARSPKQLKDFFYAELGLAPLFDRKTGNVSSNFETLQKLAVKEPLIWPIVDALLSLRSIGVFISTFLDAKLDDDGRMRAAFNIAGPETYRLSSSRNPFGNGLNLQTIPSGDRKKLRVKLPNIRKVFIPPPGHTDFDIDLDRADLQVVVWEADDADLKRQLRKGVDLHIINGILLAGKEPPPEDELIESHPNYPEHRARFKHERQLAKNFVHGTNYGGGERTMAAVCGISVQHCAKLQARWFSIHPNIKAWHNDVLLQLQTRRYVENRFGYRRFYFDRIEGLLPEALAWIPQSTVAIVTARIHTAIEFNIPQVHVTIQVHDSIRGHYPTHLEAELLPRIHAASLITIPYDDPLIIPTGLKTSTVSWGDCKERPWEVGDA